MAIVTLRTRRFIERRLVQRLIHWRREPDTQISHDPIHSRRPIHSNFHWNENIFSSNQVVRFKETNFSPFNVCSIHSTPPPFHSIFMQISWALSTVLNLSFKSMKRLRRSRRPTLHANENCRHFFFGKINFQGKSSHFRNSSGDHSKSQQNCPHRSRPMQQHPQRAAGSTLALLCAPSVYFKAVSRCAAFPNKFESNGKKVELNFKKFTLQQNAHVVELN